MTGFSNSKKRDSEAMVALESLGQRTMLLITSTMGAVDRQDTPGLIDRL